MHKGGQFGGPHTTRRCPSTLVGGQRPHGGGRHLCQPLAAVGVSPGAVKVKRFLLEEEQKKIAKYRSQCLQQGWSFLPLVTHPFAGTTTLGGQFLHRLSRLYAENSAARPTKSERVQLFWQTYACSVMKQVAGQLRLTTYTGPQPVVLRPLLGVDEAGNEVDHLHPLGGTPRRSDHAPMDYSGHAQGCRGLG